MKQTAKVYEWTKPSGTPARRIPLQQQGVFIRRDEKTGEVILSPRLTWKEIFAGLDAAGVPDDFLTPEDRNQGPSQVRDDL